MKPAAFEGRRWARDRAGDRPLPWIGVPRGAERPRLDRPGRREATPGSTPGASRRSEPAGRER
ncbi:hypothetical protein CHINAEXTREME_05365 [Halobiforma lacisalsi AJ5]|uniref:Uncharacterized protein n=1 Tax=Natronobacterium lacisalsi AJ5 TaxID=358396 RepID=M0LNN9_NATLA|nr:hypothetical protein CHINAEXTREME_05365 [Halobiforma lacisalsi AJ5]EMA34069.1 hypothetical protein C445_08627 [Halobiforma lacisalsi AJ5]